jgi:PAS domain S-box-containing protein
MSEVLTLLVIEDNPADLDLILEVLPEKGPARFKVESASRLALAVDRLAAGGIDAVLLDLGLPDSQGLDTLRSVVGAAVDVPIVVLTGHDDEETGRAAVREGAQDYLVKGTVPIRMIGRFLRFAVERKRAEQALRDSETRYRRLFEAAKDGILILDAQTGQVVDANPFLLEMVGYSFEAFRGRRIWEISPFKDITASHEAFRTLQEKEYIRYEDLPLETRDGRRIDVEFISNVYLVDHKKVIQCNIRDISARKQAEEEIRLNEERLRRLVNILQHRAESTTEFLDYALEEAIQLTKSKIGYIYHYHLDRQEFVLNTWSRDVMRECAVTESQSVYQLEKTGFWGEAVRQCRPIIVNDFASPHPLKKGYPEGHAHLHKFMTIPVFSGDSIVAVVGLANKEIDYDDKDVLQLTLLTEVVWKVLEQKRSQERIVHLNQVLRAIRDVNNLIIRERDPQRLIEQACSLLVETRGYHSVLIVLTDPAGVPQSFAEAGLGEAFGPLVERLRSGVLPPCCDRVRDLAGPCLVTDRADACASCPLGAFYPTHDAVCTRLFHGKESYGFMVVSLTLGLGSDAEEQSLFAEIAGDIAYALHTMELQKEAALAEEMQRLAEAKLRQAQKMEALGTLAGGIAHDFNNILGIITGYTELARMESTANSAIHGHLLEVQKAAYRAKELVKQILGFSRQVGQEKQPVPIGLLVKETMKMLRASIPSTIEIRSRLAGEALVESDPTQIHQVLLNLCTNAAHAMREHGGILEVSTRDMELAPEEVRFHSGLKSGLYVELTVKDTGHGIDPDIQDRIFDPFFTTKEIHEGTGLGLSVVHGIVANHGGVIEVSSKIGEGSGFRVLLPAMRERVEDQGAEMAEQPRGTEHILLVDDEPPLAMVGKQTLERLGYRVVFQTSSLAAVEVFRGQQAGNPFDLLITDMTMPQMTGTELATALRQLQPDLPVIVCTGFSELLDAEKARSLGIDGYLMKPVLLDALARLVRSVLDERRKVG